MGGNRLFITALFLTAGLILFFTWLLLEPGADLHDGLIPPVEQETNGESNGDTPRESDVKVADSEMERIAPSKASHPETAEKPSEEQSPSGKITIHGTITVVDESGIPHAEESGTFELLQWEEHESGGFSRTSSLISVDRGAWSTEVSQEKLIGISQVMLGGKEAFYDGEGMFPVPDDAFIELKVRWPGKILLHVRASDSKTELDDVELITGIPWERDNEHPGSCETAKAVFRSVRSPITLESESNEIGYNKAKYYARCPGYAWGRIEIDLHKGGEYFLYLEPSGGLDVSIFGFEEHTHADLRFRKAKDLPEEPSIPDVGKEKLDEPLPEEMQEKLRALHGENHPVTVGDFLKFMSASRKWDGTPVLEIDIVKNGRISIDSMKVGTYLVSAEIGNWKGNSPNISSG